MKSSLDIQQWKNKYIYLLEEEDIDWNTPITAPKEWDLTDDEIELDRLMKMLARTNNYFEDGMVETGTEEWMDFIELLVGKSPYEEEQWTEDDFKITGNAIRILQKGGVII